MKSPTGSNLLTPTYLSKSDSTTLASKTFGADLCMGSQTIIQEQSIVMAPHHNRSDFPKNIAAV